VYLNDEDETRARQMARWIRSDMERQYHILRGVDGKKQAIMIKYPRTSITMSSTGLAADAAEANATTTTSTNQQRKQQQQNDDDDDDAASAYVMSQIYMAERSTAATEFLTRGRHERSVAVYNYIGFDRSHSPPFAMQVSAATRMQKCFPERLQTLVMVEPPLWLRGVLTMLTPFLSESITERIKWASGEEEREQVFSSEPLSVGVENATPLLRPTGGGKLTEPVSLEHFLVDVPHFYVYDMVPCRREISQRERDLHHLAHTIPPPGPTLAEQASNLWGSWTGGSGGGNGSTSSSFGGSFGG
jgi:CRAL/TRIO domain